MPQVQQCVAYTYNNIKHLIGSCFIIILRHYISKIKLIAFIIMLV